MTTKPRLHPWRAELAVLAVCLLCIGYSVSKALDGGVDANWDLRNYHYWTVHAWLAGETFASVGPAQLQSWHNPLVALPAYLLISGLPPAWATAGLGAIAGLNGVLIFLLTRCLIRRDAARRRFGLALLAAAAGLTGPMLLSQTGTTFTDVEASLLVLAAVLALQAGSPRLRFGLCGAFLGAAAGLKLPYAVYAVAMALALLCCWRFWALDVRRFAAFVLGGIFGCVLTGGYWMSLSYLETGNPLFPYYNALFASPYYESLNLVDRRFLPESALDALTYPFQTAFGAHPSAELPFRDPRFAALMLLVPFALLSAWAVRQEPDAALTEPRSFAVLALFFGFAYVLWLWAFGIQRYLTPLEQLAAPLLLLSIDRIPVRPGLRLAAMVTALFGVHDGSHAPNWGRAGDYSRSFFAVEVEPAGVLRAGTLYVIVADGDPVSYLLPFLPPPARAVRLTGNFGVLTPTRPLGGAVADALARHEGPLRTLATRPLTARDRALLERFGLRTDAGATCVAVHSRHDELQACGLLRPALPPLR